MKPKIVIIRGKVTAGKSTISYELAKILPKWIFVDPWKVKEMFESLNMKDRTPLKSISKKAMITIIKEIMRQMQINIIVQETSRNYLKKYLKNEIKKYNYKIFSFFLDVDLEDAIKRDIKREKPTMDIGRDIKDNIHWKKVKAQPEKGDFIINTSKYPVKKVVGIILKEIHEKKKKHPQANLIRRCW